jgi:tetratricopeptide (TPR) repeat protein
MQPLGPWSSCKSVPRPILALLTTVILAAPGRAQVSRARATADSLVTEAQRAVDRDSANALSRVAELLTRAAGFYHDASAFAEESQNLQAVGRIRRQLGQFDSAASFYHRAVALDRQLGDSAALAMDLNNLAFVFQETARTDSAEQAWGEALSLRIALADAAGAERIRKNMAELRIASGARNRKLNRFDEALADYDAAERLATDSPLRATALAEMGLVFAAQGRILDARRALARARTAAEDEDLDMTDVLGMARALNAEGALNVILGRPDSALKRFQRAYMYLSWAADPQSPFHQDPQNVGEVAASLGKNRGDLYFEAGKPDSALSLYRVLYDTLKDHSAGTLRGLGIAHLRLSDRDSATDYLRRALTAARLEGDSEELSRVFSDLGEAYAAQWRLHVARAVLDTALRIARGACRLLCG